MKEEITITYSQKNTMILQGNDKIILDDKDLAYLLKSILTNKKIENIIIN